MNGAQDADFVRRQVRLMQLEDATTAVLSQAIEDDPSVVALAFTCTSSSDGLIVLEAEFRDAAGHALGGFAL